MFLRVCVVLASSLVTKLSPRPFYSEIYEIYSAQSPCDGAPIGLLMKELKVSYVLLCKWCFNLFVSFIEELSALARSHAKFQSIGNTMNLKQSSKFCDLRAFVVDGRGYHYFSHFNVFAKTLYGRAIHKLVILRYFYVFTGTLYRRAYCSLPRQVPSQVCYSPS